MKKSILIYQVVFLYLVLFFAGCQKEISPTTNEDRNTETRSTPDLNIQFENLLVTGCCFSVTIRTTIDENHPSLLNKLFLIKNGLFIKLLIQGPEDEWTEDPNQPGSYTYSFTDCLESSGTYSIYSSRILEEGGALLNIDITDCHTEKCLYYLCWEDFAMHFRYFTGITVSNNNQTDLIIFDAILSPGGYSLLYQSILTQFPLQTEGPIWTGVLDKYHGNIDCFKAGIEEIPGLFFSESSHRIVSIHGLDEFFMPLPPVYFNSMCEE
jgi:hypothetical protein